MRRKAFSGGKTAGGARQTWRRILDGLYFLGNPVPSELICFDLAVYSPVSFFLIKTNEAQLRKVNIRYLS